MQFGSLLPEGFQADITLALERAVRAEKVKVDGLPAGFRFHDCRHYFASLLIGAGLPSRSSSDASDTRAR